MAGAGEAMLFVGCDAPAPPPFRPPVDNKLLTLSAIDPNANVVWDSVTWIVTRDGEEQVTRT